MPEKSGRRQFDRRDYRMNGLPDGLAIEPVMGCNLRCPMCAVPDAPDAMNGRRPALMRPEMYRNIIEQISDRPRGLMLTVLGEPLLHPAIVDFVAIARDAGHHVGIITNGTKLTREVSAALIEARLNYLALSLDGLTRRTYESLRRGSSHALVRQNFLDLVEANRACGNRVRLELNYVVSSRTEHERQEFYREYSPLVRRINFIPLTDWSGQLDLPAELVPSCADPRSLSPRYLNTNRDAADVPVNERVPCFSLWSTMFISAEGRAMLCCGDYKHESGLSSVQDRTLLDIWRTEVQEHRRCHVNDRFDRVPCRDCRLNTVAHRLTRRERRRILRQQRLARARRAALPTALLPARAALHRQLRERPFGHVDLPRRGAAVSGVIDVQGWTLGYLGRPITRVEVRVNGVPMARAELGFFRPDVGELHPGDGNSFCAFGCTLDTLALPNGPHVLDVEAFDDDANSAVIDPRPIIVEN